MGKASQSIISAETDIDMECLSVDWLHTLSLGIFQYFLGSLVWALVEAAVWRVGGARDARLQLSLNKLENELFRFYWEQAQQGIQQCKGLSRKYLAALMRRDAGCMVVRQTVPWLFRWSWLVNARWTCRNRRLGQKSCNRNISTCLDQRLRHTPK